MAFEIRALVPDDADAFVTIRREALELEPFAFASSVEDDVGMSPAFIREAIASPSQGIFGAFNPCLVGVIGVHRDRHVKARHKAHIWGLYVSAPHRGHSIGRQLVEAAVSFTHELGNIAVIHLEVAEPAQAAIKLYERAGFVTWGVESDALCVNGQSISVRHMMLRLKDSAA